MYAVGFMLGFALLLHVFLGIAAPEEYEIKHLPGWNKQQLPSRMWSGFADAGISIGQKRGKMHMHYWFIECEHDPANAPIIMWYNGGPGASSLFGLLLELGPFLLNDDSLNEEYNRTGMPQIIYNPFSWTKVGNLLVVNNPPPVGFSYCDPPGPAGDGYSCGNWNDSLVAQTNHQFLVNWFKQFPEYTKNEVYITGESYAGIYVPIIARAILEDPQGINLKGFAVGDGCMGTEVLCGDHSGPYYHLQFLHGHGQFSEKLYRTINKVCTEVELRKGNLSTKCLTLVDQANTQVGGYFDYNLYDDCTYRNIFGLSNENRKWWGPPSSRALGARVGGALNDYACPGPAMGIWLNHSDVRRALHVKVDSNFFNGDNGVGFNYSLTEPNVLPFYEHCIKNTSLNILVYNGDTDPGINSIVTQDKYFEYFENVGIEVKEDWRAWTLDGKQRVGGYVQEFHGNFAYLTIRGSGHMVPEFKPAAALEFLTRWVKGEDYQKYVPPTI